MAVTHPEELRLDHAGDPAGTRALPGPRRVLVGLLKALLVAMFLAVALAVSLVLAWYTYEWLSAGRAYQGVTVAGVDVSGMTSSEATAAVTPVMAGSFDGTAEIVVGDRRVSATFAELGRSPDVEATIAAAMAVGRGATFEAQLLERLSAVANTQAIEPRMALDRTALDAWLASVASAERVAPTPASVALVGRKLTITPDVLGQGIDIGAIKAQLAPALEEPTTEGTVTATATTVPLESDTNDADVIATTSAVASMAQPVTVALDKQDWTFKADRVRGWLQLIQGPNGAVPRLDPAALRADLSKMLAKKVKRKPLQTRFLVTKSGKRFGFVAGKPGRQLDASKTAQRVAAAVVSRRMGLPDRGPIGIATASVALRMTAEEAAEVVPEVVRLGGWTTFFPQGERNGNGVNIHLPARILNGTVIQPGEIFDFVRAVGPFSWARGYRMGGIIRGSRTLPTGAVAGGICSASTTMFNAAVRAGLDILSRDNHSYYISRYPLGLDATVSTQAGRIVQNMRFRNDTRLPIFVSASYGFGWVRFELYAVERTRTATFSRPMIANRIPATDRVIRTNRLRAGQSERLEYPADGMDVTVYRTVRDANGRVIKRDTFRTHYVRWNGILEVGTR